MLGKILAAFHRGDPGGRRSRAAQKLAPLLLQRQGHPGRGSHPFHRAWPVEITALSGRAEKRARMKAPRGRPKLNCQVIQLRVTLSLRADEDNDLVWFFSNIPNGRRAAAIKHLLRSGGLKEEQVTNSQENLDTTIQGLVFG
jgi:hypothetical protein